MSITKNILLSLLCAVTAASCKHSAKDQLIGRWQEVRVENPQLDEEMYKQEIFVDTIGSHTDSAQNSRQYGFSNLDTFKTKMNAGLDSFRKSQYKSVRATRFEFRPDGIILTHSDDGLDSAAWYLDADDAKVLVLDVPKLKGKGPKLRFDITELSDTLLKLKYTENFLTSTAVFKPVKKQ